MVRVMRAMVIVAAMMAVPALAWGQSGGPPTGSRPRGFMIEVDVALSTPLISGFEEYFLPGTGLISPQLSLGAQLGRFTLGFVLGIGFTGLGETGDETEYKSWSVRIGPWIDAEFWGNERVGMFFFGGINAVIARSGDGDYDEEANGFSIDLGIGGRYYVAPQFQIGLKAGTNVDVMFMDDSDVFLLNWGFYGALVFRFVASR